MVVVMVDGVDAGVGGVGAASDDVGVGFGCAIAGVVNRLSTAIAATANAAALAPSCTQIALFALFVRMSAALMSCPNRNHHNPVCRDGYQ
jgi:hypothetical protein